jgi:hypothetical protein
VCDDRAVRRKVDAGWQTEAPSPTRPRSLEGHDIPRRARKRTRAGLTYLSLARPATATQRSARIARWQAADRASHTRPGDRSSPSPPSRSITRGVWTIQSGVGGGRVGSPRRGRSPCSMPQRRRPEIESSAGESAFERPLEQPSVGPRQQLWRRPARVNSSRGSIQAFLRAGSRGVTRDRYGRDAARRRAESSHDGAPHMLQACVRQDAPEIEFVA